MRGVTGDCPVPDPESDEYYNTHATVSLPPERFLAADPPPRSHRVSSTKASFLSDPDETVAALLERAFVRTRLEGDNASVTAIFGAELLQEHKHVLLFRDGTFELLACALSQDDVDRAARSIDAQSKAYIDEQPADVNVSLAYGVDGPASAGKAAASRPGMTKRVCFFVPMEHRMVVDDFADLAGPADMAGSFPDLQNAVIHSSPHETDIYAIFKALGHLRENPGVLWAVEGRDTDIVTLAGVVLAALAADDDELQELRRVLSRLRLVVNGFIYTLRGTADAMAAMTEIFFRFLPYCDYVGKGDDLTLEVTNFPRHIFSPLSAEVRRRGQLYLGRRFPRALSTFPGQLQAARPALPFCVGRDRAARSLAQRFMSSHPLCRLDC